MDKRTEQYSTAVGAPPGSRAAPLLEPRLQAFGALAVLDAATLQVLRCTADAPQVLGCDAPTLLGESFGRRLPTAARKVFTTFQQGDQASQNTALPFPVLGPSSRRKLPVCLHRRPGLLLAELLPGRRELTVRTQALTGETVAQVLASSHRTLLQAGSHLELCQLAATLAQARLGFAYAAVLRYEPSGAALTQALAGGAGSRAGGVPQLHPAPVLPIAMGGDGSRHQLILLADTESPFVELELSSTAPAPPVELRGCLLHAPAPACVDHVRALGGRAMLAVRLEQPFHRVPPVAGSPPWGLLLCWDPRPQVPRAAVRALAQSLAQLFSSQLTALPILAAPDPLAPPLSGRRGESEHRLQERQKLDSLGVLAAGIAHDFNNLLTGILGNASLLRAQVRRGRHTDSYLNQIEETSLRAAELCKQMLAYAGKGQFTVRQVYLNALVVETLPLLDLRLAIGQAVRLQLQSELPPVCGDAEQLRQVLSNLLRNAAEALPRRPLPLLPSAQSSDRIDPKARLKDGQIIVSTTVRYLDAAALYDAYGNPEAQPGEYVALEVRDTGCGIAAHVQARMFEPFFTTKPAARGLGLSTAIGSVRQHGGVLLVRSDLGYGSTFTVLLPAGGPARVDSTDAPAAGF